MAVHDDVTVDVPVRVEEGDGVDVDVAVLD